MIKDITGIILFPGNKGRDCIGNGNNGQEPCCDECDYFLCCIDENYPQTCFKCFDENCPRSSLKFKLI